MLENLPFPLDRNQKAPLVLKASAKGDLPILVDGQQGPGGGRRILHHLKQRAIFEFRKVNFRGRSFW